MVAVATVPHFFFFVSLALFPSSLPHFCPVPPSVRWLTLLFYCHSRLKWLRTILCDVANVSCYFTTCWFGKVLSKWLLIPSNVFTVWDITKLELNYFGEMEQMFAAIIQTFKMLDAFQVDAASWSQSQTLVVDRVVRLSVTGSHIETGKCSYIWSIKSKQLRQNHACFWYVAGTLEREVRMSKIHRGSNSWLSRCEATVLTTVSQSIPHSNEWKWKLNSTHTYPLVHMLNRNISNTFYRWLVKTIFPDFPSFLQKENLGKCWMFYYCI